VSGLGGSIHHMYIFLYPATNFETLRKSCLIFSIMAVWFSMFTASKTQNTSKLAVFGKVTVKLKIFSKYVH
jgi:hypothetical protein